MKKGLVAVVFAVAVAALMFCGCASTETAGGSGAATTQAAVASGSTIPLWTFETGTDGWTGKGKWAEALTLNTDVKFIKEGSGSLKVNAKGSKAYNQDIMVLECPCNENFGKLKALKMDVFVPNETIKGLEYLQIFLVVNGSANSWYQLSQGLKAGWNTLTFNMDPASIDGDIWKLFLVVNSGTAVGGPLYIDNIVGVM